MNIYVNTTPPNDASPAPGWHFARVFAFVGLGLQAATFEGRTTMRPTFLLGLRLADSGGKLSTYWKQYRVSTSMRSTYRQHMQRAGWWQEPMDPTQLVGRTALIYFNEAVNKDGSVGIRVIELSSVFRLPKGGFHATSFS